MGRPIWSKAAVLFACMALGFVLSGCTLWGWGVNGGGSIGRGEETRFNEPEPAQIGEGFSTVVTDKYRGCALDLSGKLFCWGDNTGGELDGEVLEFGRGARVQAPTQIGTSNWLDVAVDEEYLCAIRSDETLWCWDGVTGTRTPTQVGSASWRVISSGSSSNGYGSNCGIQTDQTLRCWRPGFAGSAEPIGPGGWEAVAEDEAISDGYCGLRNGGEFWCWTLTTEPYRVDDQLWLGLPDSGSEDGCHLKIDGSLWCRDAAGGSPFQLGSEKWLTFDDKGFRCGIQVDRSLWCRGDNDEGRGEYELARVGDAEWLAVSAEREFACGIQTDASLWCWGDDNRDRLGTQGPGPELEPVLVNAGFWRKISAGSFSTCGIDANNGLWCWGGSRVFGQVPFEYTITSPVKVGNSEWLDIDVAVAGLRRDLLTPSGHACGVQTDQTLWCWGPGDYGKVGVGPEAVGQAVAEPTQVDGEGWVSVAVGGLSSCAIKEDASLWCWGRNIGGTGFVTTPQQVGDAAWKQVSVGNGHICGLQTDDSLWCWGLNYQGTILGDPTLGDPSDPLRPEPVPSRIGTARWAEVSAGVDHSCAVQLGNRSLWCWGYNDYGQVGSGYLRNEAWLTRVSDEAWRTVSAGEAYTCGVLDSGSLWCWGYGERGRTGLGGHGVTLAPHRVGDGDDWVDVDASSFNTFGIRSGS